MKKMFTESEIAEIAASGAAIYRHFITLLTTNNDTVNFIVYSSRATAYTKDDLYTDMDKVIPNVGECMFQALGTAKVVATYSTISFSGQIIVFGVRPNSMIAGNVTMYYFNNTITQATTNTVTDIVKKI